MAKQYCNAEQALTPKLIPTFAVLFLVSVALLTPAGVLSATQAQGPQLQNIEPTQAPGQRVEPGKVPDGLSNGDWASIQRQIAAAKYRAYQHANDGFVSSNPAHGWQIRYAADGTTTLRPRDRQAQAWHLGLKLSAVGFTELQPLDRPAQITADDFTVSYHWNDTLREWWVNTASDLEQWFELEQRPPGAQGGQPLTLEMTLATDLVASQHGNALRFVNAAGTTISYNQLKAWDASGRELPARMQLAVSTLSLIIDDTDASYPLTIDPSFEQQAYVKASNTDGDDSFGWSVAISGDTLVVGAVFEDGGATGINGDQSDNSAADAGAAYVFTRSGMTWSQQAYLKASNTDGDDQFGQSVAISGDTLVVGANGEASNATGINGNQGNNSGANSGAAYVFTRSGTTWSQQAYLKASNTGAGDWFGLSVSISGDTLVVGAFLEDSAATGVNGDQSNNSATGAGAAYVFTRNGMTWSQQAYLKASNTGFGDQFGLSVAISDDTLVVGAAFEASGATGVDGDQSNNSTNQAGAAYVFTRSGTAWSQQAYLKASNTGGSDFFGVSVAISGDTLVVAATGEDSNATGINDEGDQSDNSVSNSGAVYVFTRSGTVWSQQAYLKASNTGGGDSFGFPVAISGDTLVVGAPEEDSAATGINGDQSDNSAGRAGAVYVFTRSGMVWSQQAYLKASNTDGANFFGTGGDLFGSSIAISGNTLVVGARGEDSNVTGINGDQSDNSAIEAGAVYVFFDLLGFTINAGLNDAWFNPATAGQGFFIIVFPVIKAMFVAMFTFETELPDPSTMATLGWAGQRWFTAFGDYADNQAVLDIEITSGGVFDSPEPVVSQVPDGTLTVEFEDCSTGMITYNIPSIGREGVIPIQRLADDNEALCEELNAQ